MKFAKYAFAAAAAVFTLFSYVSCFEDATSDTSPRAAIRSMTLGNFNVEMNDVSWQGRDTTVYVLQGGEMYPMTIDQSTNRIYNADSLAYGSMVDAMTCRFGSDGTVLVQYKDSDEARYEWDASLEINMTRPLKFIVVSTDDSYWREYSFQLNIHTVHPDSMSWTSSVNQGYTALTRSSAAVLEDTLYNMGLDQNGNPALSTVCTRGGSWNAPAAMSGLDAASWTGRVCLFNGTFLTVCGDCLFSSTDALAWQSVKSGVRDIISAGSGSPCLWVRSTADTLLMTADLASWTSVQAVPAEFPDSIAGAFTYPLATNPGISRTVLTGVSDGVPCVWTVLSTDTAWSPVVTAPYSKRSLPQIPSLSVIRYDGSLYAFGAGLSGFWQSKDNGTTWMWCDRYVEEFSAWNNFMQFPEGLKGNASAFSYATDNLGGIWIMTADGQVWRGAINRLNKR